MVKRYKPVTFNLEFHDEEDGPDPLVHVHALIARGECAECASGGGRNRGGTHHSEGKGGKARGLPNGGGQGG